MRHLLHFGLFVLALAAVTRADAQDRRRGDRQVTVVVDSRTGSRLVRARAEPQRAVYDSRRVIYAPSRPVYDARRAYFDQRTDLEQIVRISERWEQASARRDRHAEANVDRRLDAWLEREIRESIAEPYNRRYTQRVRQLSGELATLERRGHYGRGHYGRGHHGRGRYGHGQPAKAHGGYYGKKARILHELVALSERQVQRARAGIRQPFPMSLAHR